MSIFSVIVPNWNGKELIVPCLDSLLRSTFNYFEIIVVDNGSTDGSPALLREKYPHVCLIALDRNYGFARACNEGIKAATADIVCLLNNDIEVDREWLTQIKAAMDRHPECSMGTSKMFFHDQRDVIYNTGDTFSIACKGGGRGLGEKDHGQYEKEEYVFGACAGAGIYRKKIFHDIGFFDEDFFIFSEDVDFNLRANYFGHKCIYMPQAKVYHRGTATVGFHSNKHVFLFARNDLYVLVKNYGVRDFGDHWRALVKTRLALIWETARAGQGGVVFMGWLSFLVHFFTMVRKRFQLRRKIKLSFKHFRYLLRTNADVP